MADDASPPQQLPPVPARQLSLIPYAHDARDVVLRRGRAIVVYDTRSRQLSVRDDDDNEHPVELIDCPYCHRPLHPRDLPADAPDHARTFGPDAPDVSPEYFGLLAASRAPSPVPPSTSPTRRLQPALPSGSSRSASPSRDPPTDHDDSANAQPTPDGIGISASAFSPGYFKRFFREERELGRGGNGVVLLVEHVIEDVPLGHFACKRIPVGDSRAYFEKVIIEVRLLQRIPHKNLVAYHWTWLEDHQPSRFGPSVPCLWILQDYCNGGDLHSYVIGPQVNESSAQRLKQRHRRKSRGDESPPLDLHGPSKLSFDEIFSFFRDITSGLHHLHSKGYIHRDLKPSNCLLQHDGGKTRVLISDFGEVQAASQKRASSGATGTISYCAPEVLQRTSDGSLGQFTTKSDIFSLGMIVYFMCFGRLPYASADDVNEENEDLDQLRAEITRWSGFGEEVRLRPDLPERLYRYLRRLLSVDPNERPSTDEILASIKGNVSLGDPATEFGPRISSAESSTSRPGRIRKYSQAQLSPIGRHITSQPRSRSPTKRDATNDRSANPAELSLAVSSVGKSMSTSLPLDGTASPTSPRLMLPPPPPPSIINRIFSAHFLDDPRTAFAYRSMLFLAKLLSLSAPCAPYAANKWLLYPLLLVASLDLQPTYFSLRQSLILLVAHMVIVITASQHARLCEARDAVRWDAG